MISLLKKYRELILYLVFGVLTTAINIVTYYICKKIGINYQISNIIAWIFSVLFAFITNKIYVFESNKTDSKTLIKEISSFFSFRLLSLAMDMGCMYILVEVVAIDDMIAKIISNIIVIVANYIFSKLFIFKKN